MLRKTIVALAIALGVVSTAVSTTAFAAGHGGGGHGGGFGGGHFGGGHFGGGHFGGGHFGGGFHGRHFAHPGYYGDASPFFGGYDDYAYSADPNCYRLQRYHTKTGWHTRRVYVCQ